MEKEINGYEGIYTITDAGVVYSISYNKTGIKKALKPQDNGRGYLILSLSKNGKISNYLVHRLVCETFVENIDNKKFVNHKDGNKKNNNVDNLEWCTFSENMRHGFDNGLIYQHKGEKNKNSKYKKEQILKARKLKKDGLSNKEISNRTGIPENYIYLIIKRKVWKHI